MAQVQWSSIDLKLKGELPLSQKERQPEKNAPQQQTQVEIKEDPHKNKEEELNSRRSGQKKTSSALSREKDGKQVKKSYFPYHSPLDISNFPEHDPSKNNISNQILGLFSQVLQNSSQPPKISSPGEIFSKPEKQPKEIEDGLVMLLRDQLEEQKRKANLLSLELERAQEKVKYLTEGKIVAEGELEDCHEKQQNLKSGQLTTITKMNQGVSVIKNSLSKACKCRKF